MTTSSFFIRSSVLFIASAAFLALLAPNVGWAAEPNISLWPTGYWGEGGLVSCTGDGSGGTTMCTSFCNLLDTLKRFIYFGMTLALFVFTPIWVLIGGIMMMISGASPAQYAQGKKILEGVVWAIIIVLGAFLIVDTFFKILSPTIMGNPNFNWASFTCNPANLPGTISN